MMCPITLIDVAAGVSNNKSALLVCLLAFLFCTSCALPSHVAPPANSQNLSVNLPPWAQGRLFAISDTAPFAHHLQQDLGYVNALHFLTMFFSKVEQHVNLNRRSFKSAAPNTPCNIRPASWQTATHNVASNRGWPVSEANGSTCITDYYGVPSSFPLSAEQARETFVSGFSSVQTYAYRIMLDTVGNWTNTGADVSPPFEFPSQVCTLHNFGAFRFRRKWRVSIGLTNIPGNMHVPDGQRQSIAEVHRVENETIVAALMTLPIHPGTGEKHSVTDLATTIIATWGGAVNPFSSFEPSTALDNVGLKAALAKGANFAQQMEDVILASNTAILAFPLVLNLVPMSLITDCERWKLVISVLLSDVLTALPILIKGLELWNIGRARFTEIVTRMGDTAEEHTIAAEMWIATCRVRHNARTIGIVFIIVGCVAILAGVVLELIASSLMGRTKKRKQQEREEIQYLEHLEQTGWKYYNQVYHPRNFSTHAYCAQTSYGTYERPF